MNWPFHCPSCGYRVSVSKETGAIEEHVSTDDYFKKIRNHHPFATLKPCASTGKQHPQWRPPHWQPDRR